MVTNAFVMDMWFMRKISCLFVTLVVVQDSVVNPQFYVSGKRPMAWTSVDVALWHDKCSRIAEMSHHLKSMPFAHINYWYCHVVYSLHSRSRYNRVYQDTISYIMWQWQAYLERTNGTHNAPPSVKGRLLWELWRKWASYNDALLFFFSEQRSEFVQSFVWKLFACSTCYGVEWNREYSAGVFFISNKSTRKWNGIT